MTEPKTQLDSGIASMQAFIAKHGLRYVPGDEAVGSGGHFARGELVAGPCRVQLSYRLQLGEIHLESEGCSMSLEQYLRTTGAYHDAEFPSSRNGDPQQFRALANDLEKYCSEFLAGDASPFLRAYREWKSNPDEFSGLRGLPG